MILIKRYSMPIVIAVVLYSFIYFIFGDGSQYIGTGFILSVLLSYLIRICDDIGDYESDKATAKAPIHKVILIVLGALVVSVFLSLTFFEKTYLMIIAPVIILSQFFIKNKYRDIIKPLFMPTIIISVVFSFFAPNFWLYVLVPLLIILDIILIVYKRNR